VLNVSFQSSHGLSYIDCGNAVDETQFDHQQHSAWALIDRVQVLHVGHVFVAFDYCSKTLQRLAIDALTDQQAPALMDHDNRYRAKQQADHDRRGSVEVRLIQSLAQEDTKQRDYQPE